MDEQGRPLEAIPDYGNGMLQHARHARHARVVLLADECLGTMTIMSAAYR